MSASNSGPVPQLHYARSTGSPPPQPPRVPSFRASLYLVAGGIFIALFLKYALHSVPEGHVGVYWRGGKLLPHISEPGMRLKLPILDVYAPIQVTLQTDKVVDIPCGTKGGTMIHFGKVQVVNRLRKAHVHDIIKDFGPEYDKLWIFSKIHHEMNQLCSKSTLQEIYVDKFDQIDEILKEALQADCTKYAPGIDIISVRVTKPRLPAAIVANYEAMEAERTRVNVARERAVVVHQEAQTEHKRAVMMAEKEAETSRIRMQQLLQEREAERAREMIQNDMYLSKHKALADAEHYRVMKEAEANVQKLTPEFLQMSYMKAISNNTKMYFGDKLPSMLLELHQILPVLQDQLQH